MRIPRTAATAGRYALALLVVAGSLVLGSAPRKPNSGVALRVKKSEFTVHDKAYYADPGTVYFVRPGLNLAVQWAKIAQDGTISVDFKIADPKGLPLDINGVYTPGAVRVSYIAAYLPKGESEFWDYTVRPQTSSITNATANQASSDSGGTLQTVTQGEYIYTFKTKAVGKGGGAFDPNATHRIGLYGSRDLSDFDMGAFYEDAVYDFVPNGSAVTSTHDVVRTGACNKCHDSLAAHGGSRKSMELCVMCHTSQTVDPDTGNTLDSKVFFHKLHMGASLPSVQTGGKYQIIGHGNSVADYSGIVFPANPGDPRNCQTCHDPAQGATQQNAYLTAPSRAACGSCHDNVNFATGANHVNLPQMTDAGCRQCHIPTDGQEFTPSILGAHANPTESASAPGIKVNITRVDNGIAGKAPLVTFTIKDNSGMPITMKQMTGGANRIALVMAGPTTDYGYTSFGPDVKTPGYVSENPVPTAQCGGDGTCTYQFQHAIPADAKGTYAIGIEARRALTLFPGADKQIATEYGAKNVVYPFSVDGSPIKPRRKVVDITKCNGCHVSLSLHGENRNQIEQCVLCHNPSESDMGQRANAKNPADKAAPAQGVNFAYMIHRIHTGEGLQEQGASYTIVGYGGSHNDFSDVRYPAMSKTGSTGFTQSCYMCHVNGSEAVLPVGKNPVTNPSAALSPAGAVTSACSSCHTQNSMLAHALTQTDPKFGESCNVCHGGTAEFNTTKVHAQ